MTFRKSIFWLHLAAGLIAGTVIAILCLTGTALAFEKEIIAYAERDARRIESPAPDAARLPLADLLNRVGLEAQLAQRLLVGGSRRQPAVSCRQRVLRQSGCEKKTNGQKVRSLRNKTWTT
jgi:uncharacterized iron-regulated membrane protein